MMNKEDRKSLKTNRKSASFLAMFMALVMVLSLSLSCVFAAEGDETTSDTKQKESAVEETSQAADNAKDSVKTKASKGKVSEKKKSKSVITVPKSEAGSAVVFSGSTSQLVYDFHGDRKLSPGSLTKIMTAMIVIDGLYDDKYLNTKVDITAAAAEKDKKLGAPGETIKVGKLIQMMLVNNSDGAADLLVAYSASNTETFVNQMNAKAISIGLVNTQFKNATGAYHAEQYSSAYDCAVMLQYALRYPLIRELLESTKNDIEFDELEGSMQGVISSNKAIQYAGFASKKDMELIVVMLDCNEKTRQSEAKKMLQYGFVKVMMHTVVKADKKVGYVRIRDGAQTRVPVYTKGKGYAYIPPEGSEALIQDQAVMFNNLKAPLAAGSKVGEYKIYVAGELTGTVDLVIKKDVKKGWLPSHFYVSNVMSFVCICIAILISMLVVRIAQVKKRRAKKRERERQRRIREEALRQIEIEEDRKRRGWTYRG